MTDSNFTFDKLPQFVAQNYCYSEVIEHYEDDKIVAAEEVRSDVEKLLRPFREADIPENVIQTALTGFVQAHPVGQDMDEQMGTLGIGVERELAESLTDALCKDIGTDLAELIKAHLNTANIWREAGGISYYLVKLVELVKETRSELDLDAGASLLVAKDLSWSLESGISTVKDFFESPRFLEKGISRSAFVRQVLGNGDRPASLLEAISSEDDDDDNFYDEFDEDEGDYEDDWSDDVEELAKNFYPSLEEAKKDPDAFVVMKGDWGGQIYLTCPARLVKCYEAALKKMLTKIDEVEWVCNGGGGTALYFERVKTGGIGGGMGGGAVREGLWVHNKINPELVRLIRQVISGEGTR